MSPIEIFVRYLAPDASINAFNDWQFAFVSSLSPALRIGLAIILIMALFFTATGLKRLSSSRRRVLLLLRTLVATMVLWIILMPAIELRAVSKVRSRVSIIIDGSRSMSLATKKTTRIASVQKYLADNGSSFAALEKRAIVETGLFSDRFRPVDSIPNGLEPLGTETDLARLLIDLNQKLSGRDLGAVLLFSDGTDTKGLSVERAAALGEQLGIPIYTFGFSGASEASDLAIHRIIGDDFAFVHNTVAIDVDLEQKGLKLSAVMVSLKKSNKIISTKEAVFNVKGRARVTFEFKPREIGKLAYEVSVPVQEGETVVSNNQRSLVLKVIRDRIRILQVAGRPSWDVRFLRELLQRNPNIDLISFFILRTPTDIQRASQDELALIPFPVNELFTSELSTFDIVIYQNFNYRPYRMAHYLRNIQEYVRQGGSFLMIGGDQSFDKGFYAGTPIASVLPIRLGLGQGQAWDQTEYRPRLTDQGRQHPITRIGEPGEPAETVFARLPPLVGANLSLGLMPNAQALLSHPSHPGNPPIVSVREVGKGRTMAVNTDTLWFWRFAPVSAGGAGREFDRFWNRSLRWLIRDPELARVRLKTDKSVYALGDEVSAEVKVLGENYKGATEATVLGHLSSMGREAQEVIKTLSAEVGANAKAILNFGKLDPGNYTLRTEAYQGSERIGFAEEPIVVEAVETELQSPFPRSDILRSIAEASGGAYTDVGDALPEFQITEPHRIEINRIRQVPIWDSSLVLLGFLTLVGVEWSLRRRWGLL